MSGLHKHNSGLAKSKAMLGTVGPVSRARVAELWRDETHLDGPPTPQERVLQLQAWRRVVSRF